MKRVVAGQALWLMQRSKQSYKIQPLRDCQYSRLRDTLKDSGEAAHE